MSNPNALIYMQAIQGMADRAQYELTKLESRLSAGDLSDTDKLMLDQLRIQYQEGWNALAWAVTELMMAGATRQ